MIYHSKCPNDPYYSLDDLDDAVAATIEALVPHTDAWDVIAVSGLSGVIVGVPVSMHLNVPLVIVRKQQERCHHGGGRVINEHHVSTGRVVRALFLDDFVLDGTTREYVAWSINRINHLAAVVATYLYKYDHYDVAKYTGSRWLSEFQPVTS